MANTSSNADANERRDSNQDRRGSSRNGKFDRRKNRCGSCHFFCAPSAPSLPAEPGFCQHHSRPFAPADYACVSYQPKSQ